jgi:hypothetical protein
MAQCWMLKMGYWCSHDPKGQYVNGHEWKDVVKYWQEVFIPAWKKVEGKLHTWMNEDLGATSTLPQTYEHHTVVWFHDCHK